MLIKYIILFSALQFPLLSIGQCNSFTDSLALVSLYNATDGSNWLNGWDLDEPVSTWYGITLNSEGCVHCIDLDGRLDCSSYFNNIGNNLIGHIPDSLSALSQIKYISLGNNFLSGSIPSSLGQLQNLIELIFRRNNLTGSIPAELGNLQDLDLLNLSYNDLSGELPEELGSLDRLDYLFLFDNDFSGPIPSTFSSMSQLFTFGAADNRLTGEIPAFLGELNVLHRLDLQNNEFTGCFPEELRSLCDDDVNFSGNIGLSWQGDFDQFCNSFSQFGAPCEDGLAYTINYIDSNCDCIAMLTSVSTIDDISFNIFPNPIHQELQITGINQADELHCIILTMDGKTIDMFEGHRYDVSSLSKGIYLLAMQNETTGQKGIIKVIKQ